MTMAKGIWAIAAALTLGILSAPASAAPAVGAGLGGVKAAVAEQSNLEQAAWISRCFRDRFGDRRCRRVWVEPSYRYGPGFYFDGGRRHYGSRRHFRGGHGGRR
jgi:hypothetical protein